MPTEPLPRPIEGPPELVFRPEEERERENFWRDYSDATFGDGFKNAANVAKVASLIPGPSRPAFELAEKILNGFHEAYEFAKLVDELVFEMKQSDALAKGLKELLKKGEGALTKAAFKKAVDPWLDKMLDEMARKLLDKILKKKGLTLSEPARKLIIEKAREYITKYILEEYFNKNIPDPAIEKGKKEFEERMDPQERNRRLWEESRGLRNNGLDQPTLR